MTHHDRKPPINDDYLPPSALLRSGADQGSLTAALIAAGLPLAVRIPQACRLTGLGRTKLYEAIRAGRLCVRKDGRATVILTIELMEYLKHLPNAPQGRHAQTGSQRS